MTLRTKTLTAVAALTISAGFVFAQDSGTPAVPAEQPASEAQAAPESGTAPAETTTEAASPAETAAPADEAPAAEIPATEEPAAEATAPEQPAATDAEPEAEAAAETPAAEPAADADEAAEPEAAETEAEPEAEEPAEDEQPAVETHVEDVSFSFEGPFGKYDQFQLQRGLQVFTEVCSACHGMKFVPIRTLGDDGGPGLPADQVRAYAAELAPIMDPETEEERDRLPTDHFPTVEGMGMGPDLSLMAKARAGFHGPYGVGFNQLVRGIGGPEFIHAILTGYTDETSEQADTTLYENTAFPGGWISMPPPLMDDMVEYADGTPATLDQMSMDLSAFLMWAAEPKMMDRKQVGLVSVLLLIVLSALLYLTNKRIWAPHKDRLRQKNV